VELKIEVLEGECRFEVSRRRELHLTILIEKLYSVEILNFPFLCRKLFIIYKEIDGKLCGYMEFLTLLNIESEY
jgi:predicted membrane GTPase involved in stress response